MSIVSENTRDRIFREAVMLFAEKGFHGTSMRDLAARVGIKESSVYNHFKGKESILDAILEYQMNGFNEARESIDKSRMPLDHVTDPVEFWLAGASVFLGNLPELNQAVSIILMNEMFLNAKCRDFYLHTIRPVQKSLTLTILTAMKEKGMISEPDLETAAEQYVYFLEGINIEHRLLLMNGSTREELNAKLFEHLSFFIRKLV